MSNHSTVTLWRHNRLDEAVEFYPTDIHNLALEFWADTEAAEPALSGHWPLYRAVGTWLAELEYTWEDDGFLSILKVVRDTWPTEKL